ncbi:YheT family hydrolase [Leptothrix ochracea]|uniref:YheT family hydrolase n=1 Tax=Leptothrix ochracea TaxID=735331 RepID=UPI0034E23577
MTSAAPWWLPGGHAQTIIPALLGPAHALAWRRERWTLADGDFVDADWLDPPAISSASSANAAAARCLVLFHGLEGSSGSHYARAFAAWAQSHGWALVVPHFRGCSGELNRAPRAYHSGDHAEIGALLAHACQSAGVSRVVAVGVSLGGNALLRWAAEAGSAATERVDAVAAICAPLDLAASAGAISRGLGRWTYTPMFLRSMKPKALAKLAQYPGLFDAQRLRSARTLGEFDDVFTAPLHGFADARDYWRRSSAKPHLHRIHVPTLVLNPLNDPFVPAACLPKPMDVSSAVTLCQPRHGGHVGFPAARFPRDTQALPQAVMDWVGWAHLMGMARSRHG